MAVSATHIEKFKVRLEEQAKSLEKVLASLRESNPSTDEERVNDNADVGTEATEGEELVLHESLERETTLLLERTQAALARIENGTFGLTAEGDEIPLERLEIDPTVTTNV